MCACADGMVYELFAGRAKASCCACRVGFSRDLRDTSEAASAHLGKTKSSCRNSQNYDLRHEHTAQ